MIRLLRGMRKAAAVAVAQPPQFPHCDELVLHGPGKCTYCDAAQDLQAARLREGLYRFTGEANPAFLEPCPSEQERPLERIEQWPGNRPHTL